MKKLFFGLLIFTSFISAKTFAQQYKITSPDGHLTMQISNVKSLHFSLLKNGKTIVPSVEIAMQLEKEVIPAQNEKVKKTLKKQINTIINPVVAIKSSIIKDEYNSIRLFYKNHFSVEFRAYNDAVAYRFETSFSDSITVMDERFNISLVDKLATLRPDWHFVFIGPVTKIDRNSLPKKDNIHYLGSKNYKELPFYLAGWDVAILPFALNESTKFISPTKTPEYLAGGKPVISTSITDVVTPYGNQGLVHIADTAEEFIEEAEKIFQSKNNEEWSRKVDDFLSNTSWNKTWHKMSSLIDTALEKKAIINNNKRKVYV